MLFFNFLCLLYLMVYSNGHTISKNIDTDEETYEVFDTIANLDSNKHHRNRHNRIHQNYERKDISRKALDVSESYIFPEFVTTAYEAANNLNITRDDNIYHDKRTANKRNAVGPGKKAREKKHFKNKEKGLWARFTGNHRNTEPNSTTAFMLQPPEILKKNKGDKEQKEKNKNAYGDSLYATADVSNTTEGMDNVFVTIELIGTELNKLKDLYSGNNLGDKNIPFVSTDFPKTAEIEELLTSIKMKSIETIIENDPGVIEVISNSVTETTYSTMDKLVAPAGSTPYADYAEGNLFQDISVKKRPDEPNDEINDIKSSMDSLDSHKRTKKWAVRSVTHKCSPLQKFESDVRRIYNKMKSKVYRKTPPTNALIRTSMKEDQVKTQSTKTTKKRRDGTSVNFNLLYAASPNATSPIPPKQHKLKANSSEAKHSQRSVKREKVTKNVPTGSSYDKNIQSLQSLDLLTMIATTPSYFEYGQKENHKSTKRSPITPRNLNELNDINKSYFELADPFIRFNATDRLRRKAVYTDLSKKISYNDYVNGYKHYLKFQQDLGKDDDNFSPMVKYQAHRHHKVDDIGKFILNKIPQLTTCDDKTRRDLQRQKRNFVDKKHIDNKPAIIKTESDWINKHILFLLDKHPKKFHTSQIVPLKSPVNNVGSERFITKMYKKHQEDFMSDDSGADAIDVTLDNDLTTKIDLDALSRALHGYENRSVDYAVTNVPEPEISRQECKACNDVQENPPIHMSNNVQQVTPIRLMRSLQIKQKKSNSSVASQTADKNKIENATKYTDAAKTLLAVKHAPHNEVKNQHKKYYRNMHTPTLATIVVGRNSNTTSKSKFRGLFRKFHLNSRNNKERKYKRAGSTRLDPIKRLKNIFKMGQDRSKADRFQLPESPQEPKTTAEMTDQTKPMKSTRPSTTAPTNLKPSPEAGKNITDSSKNFQSVTNINRSLIHSPIAFKKNTKPFGDYDKNTRLSDIDKNIQRLSDLIKNSAKSSSVVNKSSRKSSTKSVTRKNKNKNRSKSKTTIQLIDISKILQHTETKTTEVATKKHSKKGHETTKANKKTTAPHNSKMIQFIPRKSLNKTDDKGNKIKSLLHSTNLNANVQSFPAANKYTEQLSNIHKNIEHLPKLNEYKEHSPDLNKFNEHSPKIHKNTEHLPKVNEYKEHSSDLKKYNEHSPNLKKYNQHTTISNKYNIHAPNTNKYKEHSPNLNKYNRLSPNLSKYNEHTPSTNKYNENTPSTNKYNEHTPSMNKYNEPSTNLHNYKEHSTNTNKYNEHPPNMNFQHSPDGNKYIEKAFDINKYIEQSLGINKNIENLPDSNKVTEHSAETNKNVENLELHNNFENFSQIENNIEHSTDVNSHFKHSPDEFKNTEPWGNIEHTTEINSHFKHSPDEFKNTDPWVNVDHSTDINSHFKPPSDEFKNTEPWVNIEHSTDINSNFKPPSDEFKNTDPWANIEHSTDRNSHFKPSSDEFKHTDPWVNIDANHKYSLCKNVSIKKNKNINIQPSKHIKHKPEKCIKFTPDINKHIKCDSGFLKNIKRLPDIIKNKVSKEQLNDYDLPSSPSPDLNKNNDDSDFLKSIENTLDNNKNVYHGPSKNEEPVPEILDTTEDDAELLQEIEDTLHLTIKNQHGSTTTENINQHKASALDKFTQSGSDLIKAMELVLNINSNIRNASESMNKKYVPNKNTLEESGVYTKNLNSQYLNKKVHRLSEAINHSQDAQTLINMNNTTLEESELEKTINKNIHRGTEVMKKTAYEASQLLKNVVHTTSKCKPKKIKNSHNARTHIKPHKDLKSKNKNIQDESELYNNMLDKSYPNKIVKLEAADDLHRKMPNPQHLNKLITMKKVINTESPSNAVIKPKPTETVKPNKLKNTKADLEANINADLFGTNEYLSETSDLIEPLPLFPDHTTKKYENFASIFNEPDVHDPSVIRDMLPFEFGTTKKGLFYKKLKGALRLHQDKSNPFQTELDNGYSTENSSPFLTENSSPFLTENSSPFFTENSSPFFTENSSPFVTENSSPFETENSSPYIEGKDMYPTEKSSPQLTEKDEDYNQDASYAYTSGILRVNRKDSKKMHESKSKKKNMKKMKKPPTTVTKPFKMGQETLPDLNLEIARMQNALAKKYGTATAVYNRNPVFTAIMTLMGGQNIGGLNYKIYKRHLAKTDGYDVNLAENFSRTKDFETKDTPALMVDSTLLSYDGEVETVTNGVQQLNQITKADVNIKESTMSSKVKNVMRHKSKGGKIITKAKERPEMYYSTPLPMKPEDFARFLKDQGMDVASVTSPLHDPLPGSTANEGKVTTTLITNGLKNKSSKENRKRENGRRWSLSSEDERVIILDNNAYDEVEEDKPDSEKAKSKEDMVTSDANYDSKFLPTFEPKFDRLNPKDPRCHTNETSLLNSFGSELFNMPYNSTESMKEITDEEISQLEEKPTTKLTQESYHPDIPSSRQGKPLHNSLLYNRTTGYVMPSPFRSSSKPKTKHPPSPKTNVTAPAAAPAAVPAAAPAAAPAPPKNLFGDDVDWSQFLNPEEVHISSHHYDVDISFKKHQTTSNPVTKPVTDPPTSEANYETTEYNMEDEKEENFKELTEKPKYKKDIMKTKRPHSNGIRAAVKRHRKRSYLKALPHNMKYFPDGILNKKPEEVENTISSPGKRYNYAKTMSKLDGQYMTTETPSRLLRKNAHPWELWKDMIKYKADPNTAFKQSYMEQQSKDTQYDIMDAFKLIVKEPGYDLCHRNQFNHNHQAFDEDREAPHRHFKYYNKDEDEKKFQEDLYEINQQRYSNKYHQNDLSGKATELFSLIPQIMSTKQKTKTTTTQAPIGSTSVDYIAKQDKGHKTVIVPVSKSLKGVGVTDPMNYDENWPVAMELTKFDGVRPTIDDNVPIYNKIHDVNVAEMEDDNLNVQLERSVENSLESKNQKHVETEKNKHNLQIQKNAHETPTKATQTLTKTLLKSDTTSKQHTTQKVLNTNMKKKQHIKRNAETQSTCIAKDVAALEVVVDLMKNTGDEEKDLGSLPTAPTYYTIHNEATNAIQLHIVVPCDMDTGLKRSLGPGRIRKIFSAKMSTPVDLEYQVHSVEESPMFELLTTTPVTRGLSPGMYLLLSRPNDGYALKPVRVQNRTTTATTKETKENVIENTARLKLSKDFVEAVSNKIEELFDNLSIVNNSQAEPRKRRQTVSAPITSNCKSKNRRKPTGLKQLIKKYFGYDNICNCKCVAGRPMCRDCAASNAVIEELITEFDNIVKYMTDHCTEIQTYFWMNPSGGLKLRDSVDKVSKNLHAYYKRTKGKCKGKPCNSLANHIDKRQYVRTSKADQNKTNKTFLDALITAADNFNKTFESIMDYNNIEKEGEKMAREISSNFTKRSDPECRKNKIVKNVYSLDSININLICNSDHTSMNPFTSTVPMTTLSTENPTAINSNDYDYKVSDSKPTRFKSLFWNNIMIRDKDKPMFFKKSFKRDAIPVNASSAADNGDIIWIDTKPSSNNEYKIVRRMRQQPSPVTSQYTEQETVTDYFSQNLNKVLDLFQNLQDVESSVSNSNGSSLSQTSQAILPEEMTLVKPGNTVHQETFTNEVSASTTQQLKSKTKPKCKTETSSIAKLASKIVSKLTPKTTKATTKFNLLKSIKKTLCPCTKPKSLMSTNNITSVVSESTTLAEKPATTPNTTTKTPVTKAKSTKSVSTSSKPTTVSSTNKPTASTHKTSKSSGTQPTSKANNTSAKKTTTTAPTARKSSSITTLINKPDLKVPAISSLRTLLPNTSDNVIETYYIIYPESDSDSTYPDNLYSDIILPISDNPYKRSTGLTQNSLDDIHKQIDAISFEIQSLQQNTAALDQYETNTETGAKRSEPESQLTESILNQNEPDHKLTETGYKLAETEHKQAESEHMQAETEHKQAENEHKQAETEHKLAETEHKLTETERNYSNSKLNQIAPEHKLNEAEYKLTETKNKLTNTEHKDQNNEPNQNESEHKLNEAEYNLNETQHKDPNSELKPNEPENKLTEAEYKLAETKNKLTNTEHKDQNNEPNQNESEHKLNEAEYKLNETQHKDPNSELKPNEPENKLTEAEYKLAETEHKLTEAEHKLAETEHKLTETEHRENNSELNQNEPENKLTDTEYKQTKSELNQNESKHKLTETESKETDGEVNQNELENKLTENEHKDMKSKLNQNETDVNQNEPKLTEADLKKIESELKQSEVTETDYKQTKSKLNQNAPEHKETKSELSQNDSEHKLIETEQKLAETVHKLAETENKLAETEHKLSETENKLAENELSQNVSEPNETRNALVQAETDLNQTEGELNETDALLRAHTYPRPRLYHIKTTNHPCPNAWLTQSFWVQLNAASKPIATVHTTPEPKKKMYNLKITQSAENAAKAHGNIKEKTSNITQVIIKFPGKSHSHNADLKKNKSTNPFKTTKSTATTPQEQKKKIVDEVKITKSIDDAKKVTDGILSLKKPETLGINDYDDIKNNTENEPTVADVKGLDLLNDSLKINSHNSSSDGNKKLLLSIIEYEMSKLNDEWRNIVDGERDNEFKRSVIHTSNAVRESISTIQQEANTTEQSEQSDQSETERPGLLNKLFGIKVTKRKAAHTASTCTSTNTLSTHAAAENETTATSCKHHNTSLSTWTAKQKISRDQKRKIKNDEARLFCPSRNVVCDLQATFNYVAELRDQVTQKTFEKYVKEVPCHKYKRLKRGFLIHHKTSGLKWNWIRSKRSLGHLVKHQNVVSSDDQTCSTFEKFVKDADGIYRLLDREKRSTGKSMEYKLRDFRPLKMAKDELYVMAGDSVVLECPLEPPHMAYTEYSWEADPGDLIDHGNVEVNGPTLDIKKVAPRNAGRYSCSVDGIIRKSNMVTVVSLPTVDVVFIPTYQTQRDCTYDDLRAIQQLGREMSKAAGCGDICSIRIDEPVCQRDKVSNKSVIKSTGVLTMAARHLECSVMCRRDTFASLVRLALADIPVMENSKVILSKDNINETLVPYFVVSKLVTTHTLRKKDSSGHFEYRKSKMLPGRVKPVIICGGGYYLVDHSGICVPCPSKTRSSAGDNACSPCPPGTSSARGATECHDVLKRPRRYDWWWYPPCGYVVALSILVCACGIFLGLALVIHLVSRGSTERMSSINQDNTYNKRSQMAAACMQSSRGRHVSPSRVILARFFKYSMSSSRGTIVDSQETRFERWKEKNIPPSLPTIDFDLETS